MRSIRLAFRNCRSSPFVLFLALALSACAPGLQRVNSPEDAGLSAPPLKELSDSLRARVDNGEIPGAVVLVARDGKIAWVDAIGYQDREAKTPMAPDSIFQIASMTKPITALAVMMLVEEGKLKLDDPLPRYLPEFRNVMVGVETPDAAGKPQLTLEKPRREIMIRDLLRHTSGLTYFWSGKSLVRERYAAAKLYDPALNTAEFVSKISKLPLQSHPGTTWDYGHSYEVLARVVEVIVGMDFDRFVADRITKPLGMHDTDYWVAPAKLSRVAEPQVNSTTGKRPAMPNLAKRPNMIRGGGGLTSTANDYARFCQFLLNGGTLDGVRLVSRETIDAMRSDQLPPGTLVAQSGPGWGDTLPKAENGQGYGFGFVVRTSAGTTNIPGAIGDYYWNGAFSTEFLVSPKNQLFAIQLLQMQVPNPIQFELRRIWREDVYKAIRQ